MSRSRFEEAAERWVPGDGPVEVRPLDSGLVNKSCCVTREGRVYSLRIAAADGEELGLDRRWECAVRERAAAARLGPTIRCCRPEYGILVADWATGRTWSDAETRQPGNIDRMAQLLRRLHSLEIPRPARRLDPAAWIVHYRAALSRHRTGMPVTDRTLRSAGLRRESDACLSLAAAPAAHPDYTAVLCHSDLHRLNLLTGDRLVLLDWEYAHVSDGFWDLAGWATNNDWTPVEAEQLLAGYLQRPPRDADSQRLAAWAWLYDYVCLLWCELYLSRRAGRKRREIAARAELLATRLELSAACTASAVGIGGRAR